jgi:hypothetical protein
MSPKKPASSPAVRPTDGDHRDMRDGRRARDGSQKVDRKSPDQSVDRIVTSDSIAGKKTTRKR